MDCTDAAQRKLRHRDRQHGSTECRYLAVRRFAHRTCSRWTGQLVIDFESGLKTWRGGDSIDQFGVCVSRCFPERDEPDVNPVGVTAVAEFD